MAAQPHLAPRDNATLVKPSIHPSGRGEPGKMCVVIRSLLSSTSPGPASNGAPISWFLDPRGGLI